MWRLRKSLVLLLLAVVSESGWAQAQLTARLIGEYINPTRPVSLEERTSGASVSSTRAAGDDPMQPLIWFRTAFSGKLSVTIKGADGRYKSFHEITARVPRAGWYPVRLDTQRPEALAKIKSYGTHQLAFEVRQPGDRRWMLVAWQRPAEGAIVTLYVSAADAAGAYIVDPVTGKPRDCEAVAGVEATEFDRACSLDLKALQALAAAGQSVRVYRPGHGGGQPDDAVFTF